MLRRAKRLRQEITEFCGTYNRSDLMLDADEWRQIDYLLLITQPFYDFTRELSKTTDATTYLIFMVYNELFKHIKQSINQLRRKKVIWKKNMLEALESAKT